MLGPVQPELDAFWFHAAAYASEHRIPMLGICRGMQLLNVACGGSLYQDISRTRQQLEDGLKTLMRVLEGLQPPE